MNAGASKFHHFMSQYRIRGKVEFPCAVVAQVAPRGSSGLQPVSAHHIACAVIVHDQVVTERIEFIGVFACRKGVLQSFIELKIESAKAEPESRATLFFALRQVNTIRRGL